MKLNQKGFGAIEGLLIVIALTLIVGVGFYVFNTNKDNKKSDTSTQTSKAATKHKSSTSNTQQASLQTNGKTLATLDIPKSWKVTVAHKSNDGTQRTPSCSLTSTNSLVALDYGNTTFPGISATDSLGTVEFDVAKQPDTKPLEQYFTDDLYGGTDSGIHTFDPLTIHGNSAIVYNGSGGASGGSYKQQYYLVAHNGYVACLRWRYFDKGNPSIAGGTTDYDYSQYLTEVENIAKSIKFTE